MNSDTRSTGRWDSLLFGLGAVLLYAVLRQHTFYSTDGPRLLDNVHQGVWLHPFHFAYMPLLQLVDAVVAPLGGIAHDSGLWLSAIAAASGVACGHLACRLLGRSRAQCAAVAALLATAPTIVFFATVVELHGAHFGLCGLCYVALAAFARRPSTARGALLGAATGLGYLGHATGALLPVWALPFGFVLARERGAAAKTLLGPLALAAAMHAAIVVGAPFAMRAWGAPTTSGGAVDFLMHRYLGELLRQPDLLLGTLWSDWLRPFGPIAFGAFAALFVRRSRRLAGALLPGIAACTIVTTMLMGPYSELGAYLVPLAWPAALVTVLATARTGAALALAGLALALAIATVRAHDQGEDRGISDGCREVLGGRHARLFVGSFREVKALLMYPPGLPWEATPAPMAEPPELVVAALDGWVAESSTTGEELWISDGAVASLTDPIWNTHVDTGAAVLAHLRSAYQWEPHCAGAFAAARLRPR